ncbi:MAG: glucose-6-phosphate isomerase family protein [Patescibacteria group bacterium]
MVISKTKKDLKPVLMKGVRGAIKTPYYIISDNEQAIIVLSPGKNGIEFNKTLGYFSNFPGLQTYQCLYGKGIFIIQRNDEKGEAKEFKVVSLNPGKQVLLPAGWGMCIVNTGSSFLAVLRIGFLDSALEDLKPILEKQGFAYYIIEKKGEISFEQNPNYSVRPQIATE